VAKPVSRLEERTAMFKAAFEIAVVFAVTAYHDIGCNGLARRIGAAGFNIRQLPSVKYFMGNRVVHVLHTPALGSCKRYYNAKRHAHRKKFEN
jgi:hypothetical protein